jgi:hypothetical protein
LSTPWGTSPFATPTPVIDSVTRNPAPNPVPIPGLMPLGFPQFMAPQAAVPYMGMPPQYMVPQAPAPYMGMPALGLHPAQALGLDMQMTPSPMAGLGGHAAVFPVITLLLSQLGLREAVSRIGDEALKQRVTASVNEAIDRTIEGVSAMTFHPWFGPGAQFTIYPIAAQLALIAQRYPDGAVRDGLLNIAGQILQKTVAPTGEGSGRQN